MALPWQLIRYGTSPANPAATGGPPPWVLIGYGADEAASQNRDGGGGRRKRNGFYQQRVLQWQERLRQAHEDAQEAERVVEKRALELKRAKARRAKAKAAGQERATQSELRAIASYEAAEQAAQAAIAVELEAARELRAREDAARQVEARYKVWLENVELRRIQIVEMEEDEEDVIVLLMDN